MASSESFDYIIVGGGTAGLVLANRLSKDENVSVAVIEAGGDATSDPRSTTPAFWNAVLFSELDWKLATVPQEGLNGRRLGHSQGKMLGGTSSMNAQVIAPPSAADLDAWGELGNEGWSWETAAHLGRIFSLQLPDEETNEQLNTGWAKPFAEEGNGIIKTSFTGVKENPINKAWVQTFENLGFPLTGSPFYGHSTGPYNCASTVDPVTKTRVTSASAYYLPISDRPNLKVFLHATADKVILEQANPTEEPRATGVSFKINDDLKVIKASREVIVSAGVFNSPKLLELSGIGDPAILKAHNIEVKVDNQFVGTNLQDHLVGGLSFEVVDGVRTADNMIRQDPEELKRAMELWQEHKAGPFASSGIYSLAYLPTPDLTTGSDALAQTLKELEESKISHPLDSARHRILRNALERRDEGTAQYLVFPAQVGKAGRDTIGGQTLPIPEPENYVSICASLAHPLSTGTVHISSSDSTVPPTIDHKYLSNKLDLDILARHMRYIETIAATAPFSDIVKKDGKRNDPKSYFSGDLEKAKDYTRLATTTHWHSVGTCAMAPKAKGGVVDAQFRVHGVKGLRVVDASVMPFAPQSNTQTLTYCLAEKAAEFITGKKIL